MSSESVNTIDQYNPEIEQQGLEEDEYLPIKKLMTNMSMAPQEETDEHEAEPIAKLGIFHKNHKEKRIEVVKKTFTIYAIIGSLSILIFSIYWGSLYRKNSHLNKVKMLAVVEDDGVISNSIWETISSGSITADWRLYRTSEFMEKHNVTSEQLGNEVLAQVHGQRFWASLFVAPGSSDELVNSLSGPNQRTFNFSEHVTVTYESGRDPTNVKSVLLPIMQQVEAVLGHQMLSNIIPKLATGNTLSPEQFMIPLNFKYIDYRPVSDSVLIAPLQIGVIYIILLTFLHFNFLAPINAEISKLIPPKHYIRYRITLTLVSYFFISLFFSLVTLCFQVDFTKAFGRAGFVVYWMTTYLTMLAVGGANDNSVLFLMVTYPPLIGFWLLFWVISNIAPAFTPMALTNSFYRYGYAWPGHAALELYKVILLDVYKGHMGYNYGVLTAWAVVNGILFPFVVKFVNSRLKKREAAK